MHNGWLLDASLLLVECSEGYLLCQAWHSRRKSAETEHLTLNGLWRTLTFHQEWCIAKPMDCIPSITKGVINLSGSFYLVDRNYCHVWTWWQIQRRSIHRKCMCIFCEIWDTNEFGPGWDSNPQPSDLWANHLWVRQEDSGLCKLLIERVRWKVSIAQALWVTDAQTNFYNLRHPWV